MGVPIFGPLARRIFGTRNQRMVKRYLRVVSQVNQLESATRQLTDEQLRGKTEDFRRRFRDGAQRLEMLPEVFAVAREAMDRAVGIRNIFNPEGGFDPSRLPADARALFDQVKASWAARRRCLHGSSRTFPRRSTRRCVRCCPRAARPSVPAPSTCRSSAAWC
jgi:hypothetical protein